jgi:hypothetical protein
MEMEKETDLEKIIRNSLKVDDAPTHCKTETVNSEILHNSKLLFRRKISPDNSENTER